MLYYYSVVIIIISCRFIWLQSMAEATDEKSIELEKKLKSETENRKMAESMVSLMYGPIGRNCNVKEVKN